MHGPVADWDLRNACGWRPAGWKESDALDHSKRQIPLLHAREVCPYIKHHL